MGIEGVGTCYMQKGFGLLRRSIGEIIAENIVGEEYWQQLMRWPWASISETYHWILYRPFIMDILLLTVRLTD